MTNDILLHEIISEKIHKIRNIEVMFDVDLAGLYGVETKRVNEAVKNNPDKFPDDFMFELTQEEFEILRSKFSTAKFSMTRTTPKVFTEQGVYMLATILKSKKATDVTIEIMRTFTHIRQFSLSYSQIVKKLTSMEAKYDKNFQMAFQALQELMADANSKEIKEIGFERPDVKKG